jgi:hypothetical protein
LFNSPTNRCRGRAACGALLNGDVRKAKLGSGPHSDPFDSMDAVLDLELLR